MPRNGLYGLYLFLYGIIKYMPPFPGEIIRYWFLKLFLKHLGKGVMICEGTTVFWPSRISIGDNCSLNEWVHINGYGGVEIGDWVRIAHGVTIVSSDHGMVAGRPIGEQDVIPGKVTIGNDVWIGAGVQILKGVTIGESAVIGAGAVVTRDVPAWAIAVGVPARVIRTRKTTKNLNHGPLD